MQQAIDYLASVTQRLDAHALFTWITSTRHDDPRRHLDNFVPCLGFILSFPFYNERYLAYDDTTSTHPAIREAINHQVEEDRTHSRLFLHDLRRMNLAEVWGLERPSAVLWALFGSLELAPFRECLGRRIRCIVSEQNAWPPFRYIQMEELERFGNQVFSASTEKSREIEQRLGVPSTYFGKYHLDRETGHVGAVDFHAVAFDGDSSDHAREIIDSMHAATRDMVDFMYRFASDVEADPTPGAALVREHDHRVALVRGRIAEHLEGKVPRPKWQPSIALSLEGQPPIEPPAGMIDQSRLVEAWQRHHATFTSHPFADLFRKAEGREAAFALRCSALLFGPRICGLYDFYKFDTEVDDPEAPGANVVRFLGDMMSTQSDLFFHDWSVLDMDRRIPWNAPDLMEWIYLHPVYGRPEMETMHEFRRAALRFNDDPIIKFWAFLAVGFEAIAFFNVSGLLAQRFEADHPEQLPLTYFSNLRHLMYSAASPNWQDPGHPTGLAHLPITVEQEKRVLEVMEVFASYGVGQFDKLVRALTTDRAKFEFLY